MAVDAFRVAMIKKVEQIVVLYIGNIGRSRGSKQGEIEEDLMGVPKRLYLRLTS